MNAAKNKELKNEDCVISQILLRHAKERPNLPALQWEYGLPLTYGELYENCLSLAAGLEKIGVKKEQKVLIMLPNCPEIVLSWLSTNILGAIEVPINIHYKGNFLVHEVNDCEAQVAIVHEEYIDRFIEESEKLTHLKDIIVVSNDHLRLDRLKVKWNIHSWEKVAKCNDTVIPAELNSYHTAAIMYTSGTTGPSKGVEMPYALAWSFANAIVEIGELTENDVYYVCLPLFHANAQYMQVLPALMVGAKISLWPQFSATHWLNQIRACGATVTNTLGVMCEFLFRQPVHENDSENPLRIIFSIPAPKDIVLDFERRYGVKCIEGYGMTEISCVAYRRLGEPIRLGSAGRPMDWFEVQIVNPETDELLPSNTIGEIVVRPKIPWTIMKGYHRIPSKTIEVWRNLWFHTGDLGRMDEDGYLFFEDRLKDSIRRRGENISSQMVESVINAHPYVFESAAVAVKSEFGAGGEDEIKVCVVLKDGVQLQPLELHDYCTKNMPYFAVPRYIEFLPSLPKTPSEKIRKNILRESGVNANTWDREIAGIRLSKA